MKIHHTPTAKDNIDFSRTLSFVSPSEIYTPEIDPCEKRDVQQIDNARNTMVVDAGFMRLAHAIVHPDSFSAIPSIVRPRFNSRNGSVTITIALALAMFAGAIMGAYVGMILASN